MKAYQLIVAMLNKANMDKSSCCDRFKRKILCKWTVWRCSFVGLTWGTICWYIRIDTLLLLHVQIIGCLLAWSVRTRSSVAPIEEINLGINFFTLFFICSQLHWLLAGLPSRLMVAYCHSAKNPYLGFSIMKLVMWQRTCKVGANDFKFHPGRNAWLVRMYICLII